jgi:hypothetical protein
LQSFRLFVSSPTDADIERRRVERVVSALNGEFAGLARFETIRWEAEHYRAHATFQAQIPPAADCDLVVGVLRWRLGSPLPAEFPEKLGVEPYPSGTAFEILSAVRKRQAGAALPDVFVFRYEGGGPRPDLDSPERPEVERQWAALKAFFARWFQTPEGTFKAAFNPYRDEDDFEAQLERLLRKWLAERVGGRELIWPPSKGAPFRGLLVFGARHAPVFFGRAAATRRAVEAWRTAASRFLLVVGASGAGKSSLIRAGVLPRLVAPGVVGEIDLWRVAAMRPGDLRDPFLALAEALLSAAPPPEEEGRGPALPEIAEGDCKTPADLAALLGQAETAPRPILAALDRLAERAATRDKRARQPRAALALLIDQLDEAFAPSLPPGRRPRPLRRVPRGAGGDGAGLARRDPARRSLRRPPGDAGARAAEGGGRDARPRPPGPRRTRRDRARPGRRRRPRLRHGRGRAARRAAAQGGRPARHAAARAARAVAAVGGARD